MIKNNIYLTDLPVIEMACFMSVDLSHTYLYNFILSVWILLTAINNPEWQKVSHYEYSFTWVHVLA